MCVSVSKLYVSCHYTMKAQLLPEGPKEVGGIRLQELHNEEMQSPASTCASPVLAELADCLRVAIVSAGKVGVPQALGAMNPNTLLH